MKKTYHNTLCYDAYGRATFSGTNSVSWGAVNAVRYTISGADGVIYSGTATSFSIPATTAYQGNALELRAYSSLAADSPFTKTVMVFREINTDPGSQNG